MSTKKFNAEMVLSRAIVRSKFYITKSKALYMINRRNRENGAVPMTPANMNKLFSSVYADSLSKQQLEMLGVKLLEKANKITVPQEVYTRIAFHHDNIYFDLGKSGVVEITKDGSKLIEIRKCPAVFYRPTTMGDLPEPNLSEELDISNIRSDLKKLLNLEKLDIKLALAWLLAPFCPTGTRPIFLLEGLQGCAKTTTSKVLIRTVDGHEPPIISLPTSPKDLFISASNRIAVAYDNTSEMSNKISDHICQITSGAAHSSRSLYSNGDQFVISAHIPILINGITTGATRGDLLDRTLRIQAPPLAPEAYKSEAELEALFQEKHPYILGAIIRIVQYGLSNPQPLPPELRLSRLVDFCQWCYSWAPAAGLTPEKLVRYIGENQKKTKLESLGEDAVATIILSLLDDCDGEWEGTSTELFHEFMEKAASRGLSFSERVTSAQTLSSRLTRAAPALKAAGIEFNRAHSNRGTVISLKRRTDS